MVTLHPVRAFHPPRGAPVEDLVAPVYDTLDDATLAAYASRPHNAAGFATRPSSQDLASFLDAAARRLAQDLGEGAYVQDRDPSLYVYGIQYRPPPELLEALPAGERRDEYLLLGVVGGLDLGEEGRAQLALHERTFDDRVAERAALLERTGVHFAPIMAGYTLPDHAVNDRVERALGLARRTQEFVGTLPPLVEARLQGATHRLWRLEDPALHEDLARRLAPLRAVILDGHHRGTAALGLARQGRVVRPLTMLVESRDRALRLFPWHRVVPASAASWAALARSARSAPGEVVDLPKDLDVPGVLRELEGIRARGHRGYVLVGPAAALRCEGQGSRDEGADYELLHEVLEGRLHADPRTLTFVRSPRETLQIARAGGGTAALIPALSLEGVERTAFDLHRVMAQKSTMFQPKVAEGVVLAPAFYDVPD